MSVGKRYIANDESNLLIYSIEMVIVSKLSESQDFPSVFNVPDRSRFEDEIN